MPFDPMKEMKKYQILQFNLLFQNAAEVQSSPPMGAGGGVVAGNCQRQGEGEEKVGY